MKKREMTEMSDNQTAGGSNPRDAHGTGKAPGVKDIPWSPSANGRLGTVLLVPALLLALAACGGGETAGGRAAGEPAAAPGTGSEEAAGGAPAGTPAESEKLLVYTVNYPLAYFAERIGGDAVRVELPVPADVDPAFWKPEAEGILAFQQADLILLNGAGYAGWIQSATLPPSSLVDTSLGFADRLIEVKGDVTHSHGPEGAHTHGETAFTTWLDPELAVAQAEAIRDALLAARPADDALFQQGFAALEKDLGELHRAMEAVAAVLSDQPLLASHPVYQYLARRYGLNLKSVHFEPDELPDAKGWRELEEILREHPAKLMLWEGQPLEETATRLRELGVAVVVLDPCGNRPAVGDYLAVMQNNVKALQEAVEPAS
jgi:zinc transport system substrate-binding protein